jgi:hypothetical protein
MVVVLVLVVMVMRRKHSVRRLRGWGRRSRGRRKQGR